MSDLKSLKKDDLVKLLNEMRSQQEQWKAEAEAHLAAISAEKDELAKNYAALQAEKDDAGSVHSQHSQHSQHSRLSAFPTTNIRSTIPPVIKVPTTPIPTIPTSTPLPSPWLTNVAKTKDAKDVKKLPWLESLSLAHLEEFLFHCVGVRDIAHLDMISRIRYPVLQELGVTLGNAVHNNTVLFAYLKELALNLSVLENHEVEERLKTTLHWPLAKPHETGRMVIESFFTILRLAINGRSLSDFNIETSRLVSVVIKKIPARLLVPESLAFDRNYHDIDALKSYVLQRAVIEDDYLRTKRGGPPTVAPVVEETVKDKSKHKGREVRVVEESEAESSNGQLLEQILTALKAELTCYNCNETGHFANKCPHPKKSRGFESDTKKFFTDLLTKELSEVKTGIAEVKESLSKTRSYVAKLNERVKKLEGVPTSGNHGRAVYFAEGTVSPSLHKGKVVWSRESDVEEYVPPVESTPAVEATPVVEAKSVKLFEGAATEELYHEMVKLRSTLETGLKIGTEDKVMSETVSTTIGDNITESAKEQYEQQSKKQEKWSNGSRDMKVASFEHHLSDFAHHRDVTKGDDPGHDHKSKNIREKVRNTNMMLDMAVLDIAPLQFRETNIQPDQPTISRVITCPVPVKRVKHQVQLPLKALIALFLKARRVHQAKQIQVLNRAEFWEFVNAVLDSGATFNIGSLPLHGKYALQITELDEPVSVVTANGATLVIKHTGTFRVRVKRPTGKYDLGELDVFLADSKSWEDMLIGEETLRAHGLMPEQAIDRLLEVQQQYEVPVTAKQFNARMARELFGLRQGAGEEGDVDDANKSSNTNETPSGTFRAEGSTALDELNEILSRADSNARDSVEDGDRSTISTPSNKYTLSDDIASEFSC